MQEIWDLIIYNFVGCLMIFARVTGIFSFNPILGRANVPMRVKMAMSFVLTVSMLTSMGGVVGYIPTTIFSFVFVLLKEAALGLVFGFIVNMAITVIIYAGEIIDNQIGLSMAKAMDPMTGVTMPVFANLNYYLFALYFFLTNGHLSYIKLFAISYGVVPIDFDLKIAWAGLSLELAKYLSIVFTLALKMAMPIVASELIVELCIGVMMKAIPTIQVFVINIQLKILLGMFIIMAVAGPMSDFLEDLLDVMWGNLFGAMEMIS